MKYKKSLLTAVGGLVAAVLVTSNLASAANLSQAVGTLPQNEEWSIMAYASLGQNVGASFLAQPINDNTATDYEKRILAITAQGNNPATASSENFVAKLESMFDGNQIGDASLLNDDIFGVLALTSAGISDNVVTKSRQFILSHENSDGGWGYATGVGSDSNTTAMAIAALSATGSAPSNAFNYINSAQDSSGGFGYTPGQAADGASTAWVISGLISANHNVPAAAKSFLEGLQTSDGSFKWQPADASGSGLVTAYAVIALSGHGLPVRTVSAPAPSPTPAPTPSPAPTPAPTPSPVTVNNSACGQISAPTNIFTSESFNAQLNMINNGTTTWTSVQGYKLGSQNPQDNQIWFLSRVNVSNTVMPGQTATFSFVAVAPSQPGNYSFSWQMVQENVMWFGSLCTANITVVARPIPPTPTPVPTPAPSPVPEAPTPTPVFIPTVLNQISNSGIHITITYPGNKIFDGNVSSSGSTALDALVTAAGQINLLTDIKQTAFGQFVSGIDGYAPAGTSGWQYAVNGAEPNIGAASFTLHTGDILQWFYGPPGTNPF